MPCVFNKASFSAPKLYVLGPTQLDGLRCFEVYVFQSTQVLLRSESTYALSTDRLNTMSSIVPSTEDHDGYPVEECTNLNNWL